MSPDDFASQVTGVAALAEPIRRDLYLYVSAQSTPVSRDQASEAVGVARHTAKFHLDRLVEEGLLDTEFKRLSDRGPGGGRPTKLYLRADRQFSIALPDRRYDLAGHLMATAIEDATASGRAVLDMLEDAAVRMGTEIGERARQEIPAAATTEQRIDAVLGVLAERGFEPRTDQQHTVLANCPFHELAQEHTALVCGMNLAFVNAVGEATAPGCIDARLAPESGRCCVVLDPLPQSASGVAADGK